jgi:NAD(P)-dependent dehydrogenase (short-subunit alcohol dehydrogenase family)
MVYYSDMKKTILIAGKNLPAGGNFADGMVTAGYNVVVTGSPETEVAADNSGCAVAAWNRPSSISARSLVLQAENLFGTVNETVLYFDADIYASQFTVFSPEECTRALDTMISGYEYLAMETINRLEQRKNAGRLIFLLKRHPSMEETLHSAVLRSNTASPAGPFVSAAQAAFTSFAENVAALAGDKPNVTVVLVSCEANNETGANDSILSAWLAGYLASMDNLKNKPGAKQAINWIKAGARGSGLLSLFR